MFIEIDEATLLNVNHIVGAQKVPWSNLWHDVAKGDTEGTALRITTVEQYDGDSYTYTLSWDKDPQAKRIWYALSDLQISNPND